MENGTKEEMLSMEEVYKFGLMDLDMKVIGKMIRLI
jgi:hypothetical protein